MSKFEDFSNSKVTFEKEFSGDGVNFKINLADATRNDLVAMSKIMSCQETPGGLPKCEIDLDPPGPGAKLINALERRGFDVDIDKETGRIEITKDVKIGHGYRLPGDPERHAQVTFDPRIGPTMTFNTEHKDHMHPDRFGWRERVAWHAMKNAYDK